MKAWNALTVAGVLAATCCFAQDGPSAPKQKEGLMLEVSIEETSDALSLRFKVTNTSDDDIYLFTPICTYDKRAKKRKPDPKRVYVAWKDKTTLELSKRLWPEPKDVLVNTPEVPRLTLLAAGEEHVEQISLPLPLVVDYPYMNAFKKKGGTEKRARARSVIFRLGYLHGDTPGLVPAEDGLYSISYGLGKKHQQLVEKTVDARIDVLENPSR